MFSCLSRFYACRVLFLTLLTLRTRMTHLRSLGTKEFRRRRPHILREAYRRSPGTKEFRRHRPRLLKEPYRRSMEQVTPWPRCRPHGHMVTTAYLLSDFALGSHRITEKPECPSPALVLFYSFENRLSLYCQLQSRSSAGYLYIIL
jgi:hypothetical protein